jgi:dienelactone hydrolase
MKKGFLIILLILHIVINGYSQIHSIGHRTITFNDVARTGGYGSGGGAGRQIQTEIYYPSSAISDGDSTALAPGQYPILIFGHGFVMAWSSYDNIWKDLVMQGYLVCFPRTEGGTSPSHTDFGKDLALLQSKMEGLNSLAASPFFNSMTTKVAIMGHSMGGGSSFLACAGNSNPTTMVTFAAANTNPSAIAVASQITIPTLIIAGQNDCVAPPAKNQDSLYIKCGALCKAEVTITGAAHCEFANSNTACSFGESTCSPKPAISAARQQSIASIYYSNWLKYWLKGDCTAWNLLLDSLNNSQGIVKQMTCSKACTATGIATSDDMRQIILAPNPTDGMLQVSLKNPETLSVDILEYSGKKINTFNYTEVSEFTVNVSDYSKGLYFMVLRNAKAEPKVFKFIRN